MNAGTVDILILALIAINGYITYRGFREIAFFERYLFRVDDILISKQYDRLVTSAFLHVDWRHYGFNMFALFIFSGLVYDRLGLIFFLIVYTTSLLGGNLLSLFFNRNNGDYSAVGASGAVSGIMFASIVMEPDSTLKLILLPMIEFPAWVFGAVYMLVTLFGVKNKFGNIGHEAHLGGAIAGILAAIAIKPQIIIEQPLIVALFLLPFLFFMWVVLKHPEYMMIENYFSKQQQTRKEDRQRVQRRERAMNAETELNMLLEKVNSEGIDSLTPAERQRLDELSSNI